MKGQGASGLTFNRKCHATLWREKNSRAVNLCFMASTLERSLQGELKGRHSFHIKINAFRRILLFHFHAVTALVDLKLYLIPFRTH